MQDRYFFIICCQFLLFCLLQQTQGATVMKNYNLKVIIEEAAQNPNMDDVHCPDNSSICPDKTTCCELAPYPPDQQRGSPFEYGVDMTMMSAESYGDDDQSTRDPSFMPIFYDLMTVRRREKTGNGSELVNTMSYGCCPYDHGVCCRDKIHCCPQNSACNIEAQKCDQVGPKHNKPNVDWIANLL